MFIYIWANLCRPISCAPVVNAFVRRLQQHHMSSSGRGGGGGGDRDDRESSSASGLFPPNSLPLDEIGKRRFSSPNSES